MRNTNRWHRGRGKPGTASNKQEDLKKKNKPHKYRDHAQGQRGRETGRRATTEERGGGGEDHEGSWPGSRLKVLCGDLWGRQSGRHPGGLPPSCSRGRPSPRGWFAP